jgi:tetratricopeptide (TPR) repeat protein
MPPQAARYPAIEYLNAQAARVATLKGIAALEPVARQALDEAVAATSADVARVADLQLVHYITRRAVDPEQVKDIHFLLYLVQQDERQETLSGVARRDLWDRLSGLEPTASAAPAAGWLDEARKLLSDGRYMEAYLFLAGQETARMQPLTAYAAIRAGRTGEARELLEALMEQDRSDVRLVELLRAELAMTQDQYNLAMHHFASAAESDSRFWFQAAYLCKYELNDEVLAGQFFERTGDDRVATHVAQRFRGDLTVARQTSQMLDEDFDGYTAGKLPANWRLIPTHSDEFQIVRLDGSNVLKQNELGYGGAKLVTGYPGWNNYTFRCDFKVLRAAPGGQVNLVVYDRGLSYYALNLQGNVAQVVYKPADSPEEGALVRPPGARLTLPQSINEGAWWRAAIRVQNLDSRRTQIAARLWPRDRQPPDQPQILWTHQAAEGQEALPRGRVGFRVEWAETAIDNVSVTANETP